MDQAKVNSRRHFRPSLSTCMFWTVWLLRIQDVYPGSRVLIFVHTGSRGQKGTGSRILISNTGLGLLYYFHSAIFIAGSGEGGGAVLNRFSLLMYHCFPYWNNFIAIFHEALTCRQRISTFLSTLCTVLLYSVIIIESTYFRFLCLWRRIAGQA